MAQGLPGSPGLGADGVVGALAVGLADGMDRRQIQHVESHLGDLGQACGHVAQRAVPARFRRAGAREQLVPGGVARALAIHGQRQPGFVPRQQLEVGIAPDQSGQRRIERGAVALLGIQRGICDARRPLRQPARFLSAGARGRLLHQLFAAHELQGQVLTGCLSLAQVPAPGFEVIDPALDGVLPAPDLRSGEAAGEAVVRQRLHRRARVCRVARAPVQHPAQDGIVAVGENVRFDPHDVAHHSLRREAAAIDLRR